ncbi:MAG TPA: hypothetical protein VK427_16575, partial [Kofleriaceae bacterium]|nr:hypothetical protein [Kofleriaceae bacterium]
AAQPSIHPAVRIRRHDDRVPPALAEQLAVYSTRPAPDGNGLVWKHDPLHATFGPYAYRLETAKQYWARITCPVLAIDGARSRLNLPADERAARRAGFANMRHLEIEDAGHAVQRHQPAALAAAILAHARAHERSS